VTMMTMTVLAQVLKDELVVSKNSFFVPRIGTGRLGYRQSGIKLMNDSMRAMLKGEAGCHENRSQCHVVH
jgi:hypothetical protein